MQTIVIISLNLTPHPFSTVCYHHHHYHNYYHHDYHPYNYHPYNYHNNLISPLHQQEHEMDSTRIQRLHRRTCKCIIRTWFCVWRHIVCVARGWMCRETCHYDGSSCMYYYYYYYYYYYCDANLLLNIHTLTQTPPLTHIHTYRNVA